MDVCTCSNCCLQTVTGSSDDKALHCCVFQRLSSAIVNSKQSSGDAGVLTSVTCEEAAVKLRRSKQTALRNATAVGNTDTPRLHNETFGSNVSLTSARTKGAAFRLSIR